MYIVFVVAAFNPIQDFGLGGIEKFFLGNSKFLNFMKTKREFFCKCNQNDFNFQIFLGSGNKRRNVRKGLKTMLNNYGFSHNF